MDKVALLAGGCHLAAPRLGVVLKIIANYVKRQLLGAGGARVRPNRPVFGRRLAPRSARSVAPLKSLTYNLCASAQPKVKVAS